jgi:protein-S-isoprenylcysteine O-methyltransferase Ste14
MLALLLPAVLVIHFGVILREERHLAALFGSEYVDYKARVRRWI